MHPTTHLLEPSWHIPSLDRVPSGDGAKAKVTCKGRNSSGPASKGGSAKAVLKPVSFEMPVVRQMAEPSLSVDTAELFLDLEAPPKGVGGRESPPFYDVHQRVPN